MNSQMMTYFCVAYGPASVALDAPTPEVSAFRRGNPYGGSGTKPLPAIATIHRDIDAPVAVGLSTCLERDTDANPSDLQQGDPSKRVHIGRFHATADQAIREMKEKWASLQAAGMVHAEVCCMEVSAAVTAPAQ